LKAGKDKKVHEFGFICRAGFPTLSEAVLALPQRKRFYRSPEKEREG
jgi:hypothetical protein